MLQLEEGPVPSLESVYIPEYSQISLKSILASPTEVEKHIKKYVEAYQTLISNMMKRSIPSLYPGDSEVLKMTVPCGNVELLKQNTGITSEHFAVFPGNENPNASAIILTTIHNLDKSYKQFMRKIKEKDDKRSMLFKLVSIGTYDIDKERAEILNCQRFAILWQIRHFVKAKFVALQKDFEESKDEVLYLMEDADSMIGDCIKGSITGEDFQAEMKKLMAQILIQIQSTAEKWSSLCMYSDPNVENPHWPSDREVFWLIPKYEEIKSFHYKVVLGKLMNTIKKIQDMETKNILLRGTANEICPEYAMKYARDLIQTFDGAQYDLSKLPEERSGDLQVYGLGDLSQEWEGRTSWKKAAEDSLKTIKDEMGLPFDNEESRISNMEIRPSVRRPKPKLVPMVPLPGSGGHTSRSPRRSSTDRSRSPSSRRSESNTSSKMSDGNSSHVCKISKEDVDKMSRKELLDHPISTRLWKEMYDQMWGLTHRGPWNRHERKIPLTPDL